MKYSILVNTCDKFEDCWEPFFKLFSTYWKNYNGRIYLNTEHKTFEYPNIDIVSTKVAAKHNIPKTERATWSQCLKWALEAIDDDIILYLQEDYFLKNEVRENVIDTLCETLIKEEDIMCVYLNDRAIVYGETSPYDNLRYVAKDTWRLSCQAALWKKQELLDLIREYESAWEFENLGNKRSIIAGHTYLAIDPEWVKTNTEIIPYVFTGIIKGKWLNEVVPLFTEHGITLDYSYRGFYEGELKIKPLRKIKYYFHLIPKYIRTWKDLMRIRNKQSYLTVFKVLLTRYNRHTTG